MSEKPKSYSRRDFLWILGGLAVAGSIPPAVYGWAKTASDLTEESLARRAEQSFFEGISVVKEALSIPPIFVSALTGLGGEAPEINGEKRPVPIDLLMRTGIGLSVEGFSISPDYLAEIFGEEVSPYTYTFRLGGGLTEYQFISAVPTSSGLPAVAVNKEMGFVSMGIGYKGINFNPSLEDPDSIARRFGYTGERVAKVSLEEGGNGLLTGRLLVVPEQGNPVALKYIGDRETEEIKRERIIG